MRIIYIIYVLMFTPVVSVQGQVLSCPTTAADTSGWRTEDKGDFSIRIPQRFEKTKVKGVDSKVGKWRSGSATIWYDYGHYTNPLEPNEQGIYQDLTVCREEDGSNGPQIIVYRHKEDGNKRIRAHWAELSEGTFGSVSLTIVGKVQNERSLSEMLAVIQSVRFHLGHN